MLEGSAPGYPALMLRHNLQIVSVFIGSTMAACFAPRAALYPWALLPLVIMMQTRELSRMGNVAPR